MQATGRTSVINSRSNRFLHQQQKMYKLGFIILAMLAMTSAKPIFAAYTGLPLAAPVAYTAPGLVTATSSQYFARNYNGVLGLPYVASAPLVASGAYSYAPAFAAAF